MHIFKKEDEKIKKRKIKKLASAVSGHSSEGQRRRQKSAEEREVREIQEIEAEKKARKELAEKLIGSDPQKWVIRMEKQPSERERSFFIEIIKILSFPRSTDGVVCLGKIADLRTRRIYVLGKAPAVTGIVIDILKESPVIMDSRPLGSRIGKDRRYYIDIEGLSEKDEQEIETIIQSGLVELRSLFCPLSEQNHQLPPLPIAKDACIIPYCRDRNHLRKYVNLV